MQFPLNIHIGGKEISTHLITEILGIFISYRYYLYLKRNSVDTISADNRLKILVAVCFGALIGSRLVGVLENPILFLTSTNKFVFIFSNKTIVGGLLGGLLCVELMKRKLQVTSSSGDLMTYPVILGLIIGRVGCFCEGIADGVVGRETTLPFGVNFGDGLLRHPLPLYEITFLIILFSAIYLLDKKTRLADGSKFKLFMINYLFFRFGIEFLKENEFTLFYLSTIQITTLVGIIYYLKTIIKPKQLFSVDA